MKKIVFFLFFIVFSSADVSLDKLQDLMVDKKYDIHGIFYKYDFANVEPAWDFVYVANNVFYQLKGNTPTDNNRFGWKIIDSIAVKEDSFYFVYLADIDEDNNTKFDWVALDRVNSMAYKLKGTTSEGYFSWSGNLSKLSFSLSVDGQKKQVTFHKAIDGGKAIEDSPIPKLPDLPDRLLDVNDSSNTDDSNTKTDDTKKDDTKKDGSTNDGTSNNTDSNTSNDSNDDNDCTSYVEDYGDSAPSPGVCLLKDKK